MKYHVALAEALIRADVDVIFGLIGDGNLFFVDHFSTALGGRYVGAVHESAAIMMAAGYAGTMDRVGVATVTHGPGLSNTVTSLIECAKSRIPIVVISGDTASTERYASQNIEQRPLVSATGAGFEQARSALTLQEDLAIAFRRAWSEQRPIVLNIPIEFMWADVEPSSQAFWIRPTKPKMAPDPASLDAALGIMMSAKRPIILAGKGAIDARQSLVELGQILGAPLAATAPMKALFSGESADMGIFGTLSTQATQDVIAESDCIVSFGASLNPKTTDDGGLVQGKAIIHCDIDPASIGRHTDVRASVLGDAGLTADTLNEWLQAAEFRPTDFNGQRTIQRLKAEPRHRPAASKENTVDIRTALLRIDEALPTDRAIVADVGRFALYALQLMQAPDARSWLWSGVGYASIGLGMGMAIGSSVGRPNRPTVLVAGDGGFMLGGLNEFTTAVQNKLDLVCILCNDGSYGAEQIQFANRNLDPAISMFEWPDFSSIAEAMGGTGITIKSESELATLADVIRTRSRPLLIDLRIDPLRVTQFE